MKARLLTAAIVFWLLSISTAIYFIRLINRVDIKTAVKKIAGSLRANSTATSEKRDNIIFLWHIRPPPLSAI
jgi:hypothetical protein